ncbi:MAG TPA: transglutaminase-like cysteine peptidase [Pseudolabrys sp.]|nr:transglutaminase-like cysteine peptidase [Pseudolabrys sp.]
MKNRSFAAATGPHAVGPFLVSLVVCAVAALHISTRNELSQSRIFPDLSQAKIFTAAGPETSSPVYAALPPAQQPTHRVEPESAATGRSGEPFGQTTYLAPEGLLWTKWRPVEKAIASELGVISNCQANRQGCPAGAASKFTDIVSEAIKHDRQAMIGIVNRAVNMAIAYTSDIKQYGVADYWATPFESFNSGKGDCEDYAIAKIAVLRAAKWSADDLRIVVLWDSMLREHHAVAAARVNGSWLILDNRTLAIVEDIKLTNYHPLFVVDNSTVRQMNRPAPRDGFTLATTISTH